MLVMWARSKDRSTRLRVLFVHANRGTLPLMDRGEQLRKADLKRYVIYRMKSMELLHFYLLLFDLNDSGHCPENILGHDGRMFASSMRTVAISWLATFVDQSRDGMNVFDLWRRLFPKHKEEIDRVWLQLEPQLEIIKNFRDRVGFHADTPLRYFAARDKIRGDNPDLQAAMDSFMRLEIALYNYEDEELPDFVSVAEELLLDVELQLNINIDREWFKQALILRRRDHQAVFN
jgi:hypothetical protein